MSIKYILPILIALTTPTLTASAQDTQGISIKPSIIDETIQPNQTINKTITIQNLSSVSKTFKISTQDEVKQDNIKQNIDKTNLKLSEIIKLETNTINLNPFEEKTINFSINGTKPGGYTGSINIDSFADNTNQASGTNINTQSVLLINIGYSENNPKISSFTKSNEKKSIVFETEIENNNNFIQKTKGRILIYNTFGKLVKTLQINQNALNIPPNSQRLFQSTWENPNGLGKYTAKVELFKNNKPEPQTQKIAFYLVNKYILIPIAFILLVFGLIFYKKLKNMKRES